MTDPIILRLVAYFIVTAHREQCRLRLWPPPGSQHTGMDEGVKGNFLSFLSDEDDKQYFRCSFDEENKENKTDARKRKPFIGQMLVLKQLFGHAMVKMA